MKGYGQETVSAREKNNRRSESAKGKMAATPKKKGAQSGFGTNRMKSKVGIMGKPRS